MGIKDLRKKKKIPDEQVPLNTEQKEELKKKKILKSRHRKRVWTVVFMIIIICYLITGIFAVHFIQDKTENMPELNISDLLSEESSKIYDANDNLITEIGTYYRDNITYDQCPESLIDAFLSIEDSRFFEHNGFDIPRFTSSAIHTLTSEDVQGGSTFTMQLIKNSYFSIDAGDNSVERSATIEYKVQQILLSIQLETKLSKKQIFELYMNKLNFGDRIRGVQKAARYYFNKNADEMNLSESALLAGIINLPNRYNPYHYLDYATKRRNEVLDMMRQHGYINDKEWKLARSIRVEDQLIGTQNLNVENSKYIQYVDVVIDEAQALTGRDPVIYGMDIHTALQPNVQDAIENIENGNAGIPFTDDLMQTAIVSMNNQNGEIVGVGGGRNYEGGARLLNRATSQYKQPGSSVKPVLSYALAYEYLGYTLDEVLTDKPITFPGESRVLVNAGDDGYAGEVSIKDALSKSLNIPAILTLERVTAKIGADAVVDYLHSIGFDKASKDNYHLSYAIGGNAFETTVKEMAGAHAMLLNLGVYNEPHTIRKIETTDGQVYYPDNQNIRVLNGGSAWCVDQLMYNNVLTGSQFHNYMDILNRSYPVYAKTGTSDWGTDGLQYGIPKAAMKDKWMVASTSNYTNAVWVGYDKAVAGANTYFSTWKAWRNIPGRIQVALLDAEETLNGNLDGVQRPDDAVDITYVKGTYPHVADGGEMITSTASQAGIERNPTVPSTNYTNGSLEWDLQASVAAGVLYVDWNIQQGCTGDFSLHDAYNNQYAGGACLANTTWLNGANQKYYASVYEDGNLIANIRDSDGLYGGYPADLRDAADHDIQVCGYYTGTHGTSNQQCVSAKVSKGDPKDD